MDRKSKGEKILNDLFGGPMTTTKPAFKEFYDMTTEHIFGDLWSRPGLPPRDRSLIIVAVLCAQGQAPQLRGHLEGALNLGHTPDSLKEVMIHVAHYAGWPTGMNGLKVLQEVVEEKGLSFEQKTGD